MKKTIKSCMLLFFVLFLTAIVSCKKNNEKLIIGKWECTAAIVAFNDGFTSDYGIIGLTWCFSTDGFVTFDNPEHETENPNESMAKYVIHDNQIIFTSLYGEKSGISTIKELTNNKLIIELTLITAEDCSFLLEFNRV